MSSITTSLQRETLRKIVTRKSGSTAVKELAALKIAYSEDSKLLTGYINGLVHVNRVFPRHLPTQASGRWSTIDPPITNWPRQCINQSCQERLAALYPDAVGYIEHEWDTDCWSVRDILKADDDEVMITWDHDNIEGKIHDLIVNDEEAIFAHQQGYDLHTITACNIFNLPLPQNLLNPHTSVEDTQWRRLPNVQWQGKDTRMRVLAKNFNHGSKYTTTWRFVHKIQGIERYGVSYADLGRLAKRYIDSKAGAWNRKLEIMRTIRRTKIARSLYGFRRVFYNSSEETGREGFSHMISATVSDYNNETLQLLRQSFGTKLRHNAH